MSSIYFVFNHEGKFLFKTTDKKNFDKIPESFKATYFIENPLGYIPELEQVISYDIANQKVVFSEVSSLEDIGSSDPGENVNLIDYNSIKASLDQVQSDIATLNSTVEGLNAIGDVSGLAEKLAAIDGLQTTVTELNGVINDIFAEEEN